MQYQECLRSLIRHGASTEIVQVIATFLSDRFMSVRAGSAWSKPRPVNGGVPQESILGVLLFNITTDNLEDQENAIDLPTNQPTSPRAELEAGLTADESTDSDYDCQEEEL